jgi:electron transfer flavoprotein beta subunit
MKIVVCIKHAISTSGSIEISPEGRVGAASLQAGLNEWDLFAIEEAVTLAAEIGSAEVIVVTVGPSSAEPSLRRCLSIGADRALLISDDAPFRDPIATARLIADAIARLEPDLVLTGMQSSDAGHGAVGGALAGLLDVPCLVSCSAIQPTADDNSLEVMRDVDGGGKERILAKLPALIAVQTSRNRPRRPNIKTMKLGKSRPLETVEGVPSASASDQQLSPVREPVLPDGAQMIEGDAHSVATRLLQLITEVHL